MRGPWISFEKSGEVLCEYTVKGTFPGELSATAELLAYEYGCSTEDIDIFLKSGGKKIRMKKGGI